MQGAVKGAFGAVFADLITTVIGKIPVCPDIVVLDEMEYDEMQQQKLTVYGDACGEFENFRAICEHWTDFFIFEKRTMKKNVDVTWKYDLFTQTCHH